MATKIRSLLSDCKSIVFDCRAKLYLKKNSKKKHAQNKTMKVGFIVFEPETWEKTSPIYEELKKRNVDVELIVVPSFDKELKLIKEYSEEWEFFQKYDGKNAFKAYNTDGTLIDIKSKAYDYVFYQDPSNAHIPYELCSETMVKYSKICYIPYGFSGSNVFNYGNSNKYFYRNVYFAFLDTREVQEILSERYMSNCKDGYQHFELIGYPTLEDYIKRDWIKSEDCILWTPRWSYDERVGGSHFIEYKDSFLELLSLHPECTAIVRPHPMMFSNFIKEGRMTTSDRDEYLTRMAELGIKVSSGDTLLNDFEAASILITDYSSIIPMYLLTGKPIIYCKSSIGFNSEYQEMEKAFYMADSWGDVQRYVETILSGNDYLYETRKEVINKLKSIHEGATKRITDKIIDDYDAQSV